MTQEPAGLAQLVAEIGFVLLTGVLHPTRWGVAVHMKQLRSRLGSSARVALCLLLLFVTSLDAIHIHGPSNTAGTEPLGSGHYCLLCMAAHLPLAVGVGITAPAPVFAAAIMLPLVHLEPAREPLNAFSLYMRPPPLG